MILNLIGGELVPPTKGAYLDNFEPARGSVYSQVPDSDSSDVDRAVEAASKAFPAWTATSAAERARLLQKFADLVTRDLEKLAEAEARDTGKPISLARSLDIPRAAANLSFFASAIGEFGGETFVTDDRAINF